MTYDFALGPYQLLFDILRGRRKLLYASWVKIRACATSAKLEFGRKVGLIRKKSL